MRAIALSSVKAGITRLRNKGGASPDALFDLVNGYVTAARTIKGRQGSEGVDEFPPGTKGLMLFGDKFVVFASRVVVPSSDRYVVEVLPPPEPGLELDDIRFAMPFLGFPYVVARWSNGRIVHYWLKVAQEWKPNFVYKPGESVQPLIVNGFTYTPSRLDEPGAIWAAGAEHAVGDFVEPTTFNGFKYRLIEAHGSPPRSGQAEPVWPLTPGAVVAEEADVALSAPSQSQQPAPSDPTPPRYGGGSGASRDSGGNVAQEIQ